MTRSPSWYTIHTQPRRENQAKFNLTAWGLETFAPQIKERRPHPSTRQSQYIVKPLFLGYIFAKFDAGELLHKVRYTRGVHSVVSCAGRPIPVEDETIQFIQSRVEMDGFVHLADDMKPGDKVLIKEGSFRGMHGVFDRALSDSDRVFILLTEVTYQVRLLVGRHHVEKVNACDA